MQHRRAPYLTVAAVTAAFVVGGAATPATAGAARLTKAKVEKIAAKVVDQEAPTLKVARATTADTATKALTADTATRAISADKATDSTTLGGKAADEFLTRAWTLSTQDLLSDRGSNISWTFTDLPVGTYLLQYDLRLDKDQGVAAGCAVNYSDYFYFTPESGVSSSTTDAISGSTTIRYDGEHEPRLGCGVQSGTFRILEARQAISTISLLRVDSTTKPAVTIEATTRD